MEKPNPSPSIASSVNTHARSAAVSPEAIRRRLLHDLRVPPALLQKALDRLDTQLDARKVERVTYKGRVTATHHDVDNGAVQGAIDKVLTMAGVYAREKDTPRRTEEVWVETTPDGVVRIRIGGGSTDENALAPVSDGTILDMRIDTDTPGGDLPQSHVALGDLSPGPLPPSGVLRPRKAHINPELWKLLMDEEVD